MRFPNLSLPRWSLYAIGLAPLTAIFVIIVISVVGGGSGRGGLVTFDDTGEVEVLRETPSDFDLELFSGELLTLSEEIGERPILIDLLGLMVRALPPRGPRARSRVAALPGRACSSSASTSSIRRRGPATSSVSSA